MASMYDGASDGQYSVAPPPAPISRALRRPGMRGRGPLGMHGSQFHPGVLAKLHPNHPIFKVLPGLRNLLHPGRMPPGGVPTPSGQGQPDPSGQLPPPDPSGQQQPDPYGQQQPDPSGQGQGANPYPWMDIPSDLSGLNQWGSAPEPQDRTGIGTGNPRDLLLQRFHSQVPHQQPLTSRHALTRFLQRSQRFNQARKPMLPLRRPHATGHRGGKNKAY